MYKYTVAFLMFLIMAGGPALPASAQERESEAMRLAVVDIQQLMGDSDAAKSIQQQGKDIRDRYQERIEKIERDLKSAEEKIIAARKDMSEEEFAGEREKFQQQLLDGQRQVQELNQKLDKALSDSLKELRDEIVEIVSDYSVEHNYALVISRADVVIVAKSMDITADIMKELNRKVSNISVKE